MLTIYHYFVIIHSRAPWAPARPGPGGMLGILTLDTAFPRVPGDVGCARTFDFPVRYATPKGADPERVVHRRDDSILPAFVAAAHELIDAGAIAIATTCGFLVRWQRELVAALPVPVLTSALLQVPLVRSMLAPHRQVGIVTYSAADLGVDLLACAGIDRSAPVEGVDPDGVFARTIRLGAAALDEDAMAADVAGAASRLVATHPAVGAIVLECANMPPYRDAVVRATGRPVFDAAQLVAWFHAGIARSAVCFPA